MKQKGKGNSLTASVLLCAGFATAALATQANAALITISQVVTNNYATEQIYEISQTILSTEAIASVGVFGNISIALTDFNRNGATISSDGPSFYSGWINSTEVERFMPGNAGSYQLVAPTRSQAFFTTNYGVPTLVALGRGLAVDDQITIKFKFKLSAGDQVALTGTFNLIAVPAPATALVALFAPVLGLRRRRTENSN